MQELVRQVTEGMIGVKLSQEELEELARRLEGLTAAMRRLSEELELWREEPAALFSREERT